MKTNQELLDFYGVELGKKYEITQERYLHLNSDRRFIAEIDKATDEARIRLLHKDGSPFLNNWSISILACCEYHEIKTLLTDEEKEYLRAVIKPFRDSITSIVKPEFPDDKACIQIEYIRFDGAQDRTYMPMFDINDLYLGMKKNKYYTLEELGL